ncbi:DDE Tnp4 domain-containing protein [Citrus sinensis]|uniref:DDE Tnp4 domain-containing protein n=1 Tax=Citrus sinensis TaxID=2711 RepID=A0ACB8NUP4_CITSI|nr:DDE Tnp4 domain-containing protein [Citrus sinensis]
MIHSRTLQFHATRLQYLDSIIGNSDIQCVNQLRMDRRTFGLLCELLRSRGLKASGSLALEEQVCMFLHTLSHHVKNCTIGIRFFRFGETVSRYFNSVLNKVLRLHDVLLRVPGPVPNNYADEKWKRFKNCLGALDGTYIRLCVPENDKPRYRTRKGEIATNVLRSHKDASNWRDKTFPCYERLANIFGKDHATESSTKNPNDVAMAALQEEIHDDDNEIDDKGSPMSTTLPSNSQYTTRSHSQSSNRRKSKLDEQIAVGINKLVSTFHQESLIR